MVLFVIFRYASMTTQKYKVSFIKAIKMQVTEFVTGVYLPIILLFIGAVIMKLLLTYKTKIFHCQHEDNIEYIRK